METDDQHDLPPPLRTAAFREVWAEWERYRRVEKRNKLTPTTSLRQLKLLAAVGESRAIATLDLSMTNGWVGLFPEKVAVAGSREHGAGSRNGHAPLWVQIRDTEALLKEVAGQLQSSELPNVLRYENGAKNRRYLVDFEAATKKRDGLKAEKREISERLTALRRRQAGGESA